MMLEYKQYIDHVEKNKNASPETIENYKNALKTCGLQSFDPEKTPDIWKLLLKQFEDGVSYGAVRNALILTKAVLKLHGLQYVKNLDYNTLVAKLAKAGTIPDAYNEDEIRQILQMCQKEDWNLFRIAILCTYSGLRITACMGPKYSDFQRIDPYGVYVFVVKSKGKRYIAAISEYAYNLLVDTNFDKSEYVTERDPSWKDAPRRIYRTRFIYALKKNGLIHILKGKSPFHSMRKFFAQKLGESALHAEDVKLLMGHAPTTIAWKHYIDEIDPKMYRKVAQLYSETPLATLRLI